LTEFDEIDSMKYGKEKREKFTEYYTQKVKIDMWLNNPFTNSIINFKDRVEYKKNNLYHRLNGPAIDFNDEKLNQYYYKGIKYEFNEWKKVTTKELRRIKIKKLNKSEL
jgi:hypothetical protein